MRLEGIARGDARQAAVEGYFSVSSLLAILLVRTSRSSDGPAVLVHTLLVCSALFTVAQGDSVSPKRLRAARIAAGTLRLDGRLSEPAWQSTEAASGFVQREPVEGSPVS